jgi:SAM-dependent methyltransferase
VDITAVDWSETMVADLRARLADEPAEVKKRVRVKQGDMRAVRLQRRFPLVICPFNTALHLYRREDVERFLAGVRAHLAPGGLFVADLSVPQLEDLLRSPTKAHHAPRFRHPTDGRIVKNVEYFDYDKIRQILFVSMEFIPVGKEEESWATPLAHRQFFPQEWLTLLHYNGFDVEKVEGDFHGEPLDRTSDTMVTYARARRRWTASKR